MNTSRGLRLGSVSCSLVSGSLKPARRVHGFYWGTLSDSAASVPAEPRGVSCVCAYFPPSGSPPPHPRPALLAITGRRAGLPGLPAAPHELLFLPAVVSVSRCHTLSPSRRLLPEPGPRVSSLRLRLCSCPENGLTGASFLDAKCTQR